MSQFFWMLEMGFECSLLALITPYGWAVVALAIFSGSKAIRNKQWPASTFCYLAWPLIMSGVCIAWGQTHWHEPGAPASEAASTVLGCILALYLAGAAAAVYFNRETRYATTATLSLGTPLFLGCAFVAGMAVTGNWL